MSFEAVATAVCPGGALLEREGPAARTDAGMIESDILAPVFDETVLSLPLFDDRHRRLARSLEDWITERRGEVGRIVKGDPREAGRRLTRMLGQDGWLAYGIADREPLDFRAICLIRTAFACLDDLCDFAFAIQALAAAPIGLYGSEEQEMRYLPAMASGDLIGSFAVSEPEAGSDLAAVRLAAERSGDHYVLNGEKSWISNADIADLHCVLVRTGKAAGAFGMSMLAVPSGTKGCTADGAIDVIASRSFGSIAFRDCALPADALIGSEGTGFAIAADVLERFRMTVAAAAIGFARRGLNATRRFVAERRIGGEALGAKQLTKGRLADMALALNAAELLTAQAAYALDSGRADWAVRSSMAKLHATEMAQAVIDAAVQLHGARGLVRGSLMERLYRQIRSLRIYEGTSEIQKLIIGENVLSGHI